MLHHAMEFHDATLESKRRIVETGELVLVFSAFIHHSSGEPGLDPGNVTRERIELRIQDGRASGDSPAMPCRIEEAQGEVAGEAFVNLLPVPLEQSEPFELELLAINGEEVTFSGPSADLAFLSRPAFIDLEANA